MTEPAPGGGSDPGHDPHHGHARGRRYVIPGAKWFITGAAEAAAFHPDRPHLRRPRRGLTAFLFHRDQPGWQIDRRIPIMGPEEHGGHCELTFDGLESRTPTVLLGVGDGLKLTQMRLGPARLTHCMRWLGLAKRCVEIARTMPPPHGFGIRCRPRRASR
jgi:acyl-CoA dehydrogenase